MEKTSRIYVAGHRGLVGSAILKNLEKKGFRNLITRTHKDLDLKDTVQVARFFEAEKPEYVFLAAAKVGGIEANNIYRADFLYENLMIQTNVIDQSYRNEVRKLLFLGSTCIYPKESTQPLKEEFLLEGALEYTNEPYAIAKIAGFKMCENYNLQYGTNFISVMPTSLYGPRDNFDLETSHVLPALIRKMYLGKALEEGNWERIAGDLSKRPVEGLSGVEDTEEVLEVLERYGIFIKNAKKPSKQKNEVTIEVWGSGKPMREFLWSEDMADACVFLMEQINFKDITHQMFPMEGLQEIRNTHINIGTGKDISIRDLAHLVKEIIGFKGELFFNTEKADGTMRKLTDISKLQKLGWEHTVELKEGIEKLVWELIRPSDPTLKGKTMYGRGEQALKSSLTV